MFCVHVDVCACLSVFSIALPGTNFLMVAGGMGSGTLGVWTNSDGQGVNWAVACSGATCPWSTVSSYLAYPALVGLYDSQTFVLSGGLYSTNEAANLIGITTNGGTSWATYAAAFQPRYQHASAVDLDNYVYIYSGATSIPSFVTSIQAATQITHIQTHPPIYTRMYTHTGTHSLTATYSPQLPFTIHSQQQPMLQSNSDHLTSIENQRG